MRYAEKSEIILSEIINLLFNILFLEVFSVIGEIIHKNYFSFYGHFLCIIINLIFLLKGQTFGRYLLKIQLLNENKEELTYLKVLKKEIIEDVLLMTVFLYIIDIGNIFFENKNQTIVCKKMKIIYYVKDQGENYEINSRIRKPGN